SGEDDIGRYFIEKLEPLILAWREGKEGKAIAILSENERLTVASKDQKQKVRAALEELARLATVRGASIGQVLTHIVKTDLLPLQDDLDMWMRRFAQGDVTVASTAEDDREQKGAAFFKALFDVPYKEVSAFRQVFEKELPYATKHGVKGAEFNNV